MHVTSRDGTRIAYEKRGKGPVVILVNGALSDRAGSAELAQLLSGRFTVLSYDRRGRGDSTDTGPYTVQREIEDIDALIARAKIVLNVHYYDAQTFEIVRVVDRIRRRHAVEVRDVREWFVVIYQSAVELVGQHKEIVLVG